MLSFFFWGKWIGGVVVVRKGGFGLKKKKKKVASTLSSRAHFFPSRSGKKKRSFSLALFF
jgi:hypothetical protein